MRPTSWRRVRLSYPSPTEAAIHAFFILRSKYILTSAPESDDEVAYLRFASVYRGFESLDDFEKEITALRGRYQDDVTKDAEKGARQS